MDFDALTDQINTAISSISSTDWTSVSGGLDKVNASAKGYAWGIGSGHVWICQLPCTGNWKQVDIPVNSTVKDIVTDDNNVFVLFQNQLAIKSSDNTDEWIAVDLPDSIEKITSTVSYIWGQAGNKKYKLPKPGSTGNWMLVKDDLNVKITSASSRHLYGVKDGQPMVIDEAMQTEWSVIPELGGKYSAVIGDNTALLGIDDQNSLKRCMNGSCQTMDTKGYTPQNITIEPSTKQIWMTTTTPGKSGNIFNIPVLSDYSDVMKTVQPIDAKRDQVVKKVEDQHDQATNSGIMMKQFEILRKLVSEIFGLKPAKSHEEDQKVIQKDINNTESELYSLKNALPFIQKFLLVLLLTIGIYTASEVFGSVTHLIALAVLVSGTVFLAMNK
jgi:hypothetical protein